MTKSLLGMLAFLVIGLGLGLLAGGRLRALEGRDAEDVGQPVSRGPSTPFLTGSSRYLAEMYQEKTRKRIEALKIPEAEQKAIDAAIEKKFAAREPLQKQSLLLYQVAVEPQSTDDELDRAVNDYLAMKDRFQRRIREIDEELVKRISARTRAKIMTTGALDNGLGFLSSNPLLASKWPAIGRAGSDSPHGRDSTFGTGTGRGGVSSAAGTGAGAAPRP
jgi:hypothetical protein